ncbi:MAG TPA: hypothetical protein VN618_02240 [Solirubrobacteraceae bacterium]|nr:hypothetical protein [Solirubrobacteraceae bacterium]
MPDTPLTPSERDLAEIAAGLAAYDGYLSQMLDLADDGLPASIAMVVDGLVVVGALTRGADMAAAVDKHRAWLAGIARKGVVPEGLSAEEYAAQLVAFSGLATSSFETQVKTRDQTYDEAEEYLTAENLFDWEKAPGSLSRRMIAAMHRQSLTVRDVQVFAPGQQGVMRVPVMRIKIGSISAWWIVEFDDTGSGQVPLFVPPES